MRDKSERRARVGNMRAMFAAIRGRCPNCLVGEMFSSTWGVRDTCPNCGVRFERQSGAWLGAWVFTYTVAIILLGIETLILVLSFGLFRGLEWVLVGSGIAAVLLLYRPVKGWWLWVMWVVGLVTTDEAAERLPAAQPPADGQPSAERTPVNERTAASERLPPEER